MKHKLNDGGPAFPGAVGGITGMSLRDAIAIAILSTLLSELYKMIREDNKVIDGSLYLLASESAYDLADTMIAIRNKDTAND